MLSREAVNYPTGQRSPALTLQKAVTGPRPGAQLALLTSLFLLGWWTLQQMQFLVSSADESQGALTTVDEGSLLNTLVVIAFGAIGAVYLRQGAHLLADARVRVTIGLLCVYVLWAATTVFWSVDITLTVRRSIQLAVIMLGSVGLGLGFYGALEDGRRRLALHALVAGCVAILALWGSVAKVGGANLLDPAFSAKNLFLGSQGMLYPLAFSGVAMVWLWQQHLIARWQAVLYVVACLVSVFAIKGRFITAFTLLVIALQIVLEPRLSRKKLLVGAGLLGVAIYGLGVLAALGGQPALSSITDTFYTYATLDTGGADVTSLTGRTQLWDELLRNLQEKPWAGYGFGAFWNVDNMARIWRVIGWHAPAGHEGYLDEMLGTGIVGLIMFMLAWLTGLGLAVRARLKSRDRFATLVFAWMSLFLLYNLGDSIMQVYFQYPFYASLIALFALLGQEARRHQTRAGLAAEATAATSSYTLA